ncbi:hypothetical protein [Sphingomonas sp.]|jgi:hypothetical protein|uniref:hypothetical protein n=1 Tax=Sphingomonas sp. TaxID=28214 RepID=UPI002D8087D0|nr:hypothetical protein [Sphingomonas sp.]HEU0045907.1 hypothetical protein [Sphingomonas sp.]
MPLFSLCIRDRAGEALNHTSIEAANVYEALAYANTRLRDAFEDERSGIDAKGHIDVRVPEGETVARLVCAEAMIGMS